MEAALARGEVQAVRELGHRIKSAARTVGAFGMADLCQHLEHLAPGEPAGEVARAQVIVSQLGGLLKQVSQRVRDSVLTSS